MRHDFFFSDLIYSPFFVTISLPKHDVFSNPLDSNASSFTYSNIRSINHLPNHPKPTKHKRIHPHHTTTSLAHPPSRSPGSPNPASAAILSPSLNLLRSSLLLSSLLNSSHSPLITNALNAPSRSLDFINLL